jgi:hypothetical protein
MPGALSATTGMSNRQQSRKRPPLSEEKFMEDFPIWLKLIIWGTIGLTVLYTGWGLLHSMLQS